ncbi:MAG: DHA2 family efflux MFS transporter permease subunit [Hyphomicrobiaceae bacterium]
MDTTATAHPDLTPVRRAMILVTVVMATTLYGTTLLVVSTILPQMQGSFAATADEIAWAMTFNILATAIVTPMSGWLAGRFGTRDVMVWSLTGFTFATFMCGAADSLESLVFWRILQGGFGAPSTPLTQSILLTVFPRNQQTRVMGIFGFGVVLGPIIGPMLGGVMAESYNWRWAFYALVPVGVAATIGLRAALPASDNQQSRPLDWIGFIALSIALAATQLVLARGQRLDWFESTEIIIEILTAIAAFWVFITHCLTSPKPFLDPRLLLDRNYAIGLVLVTIYGMLNFTPMVLLPPLLTGIAGYTDSLVGIVVGARGVGGCVGFLFAGFAGRLDSRVSMIMGFGLLFTAGLWLMHIDLNVSYMSLAANAGIQGLAIGLIWVPLTTVTFSTLPGSHIAEGTAVYHLLRNLGSSFFISVCVAEIVRSTGMNYAHLTELLTPYNKVLELQSVTGQWDFDSIRGLARLSKEITRQATLIAYLNAFGLFTTACAMTLPLILLMRGKQSR